MSNDNTGGPAFPHGPLGDSITFEDGRTNHQVDAHPGMSLRDWFAGMAMQGLLAAEIGDNVSGYEDLAEMAFKQADSMIANRAIIDDGKDGEQ